MFSQLLRLSRHSIIYGLGVAASQVVGFFLIPVYTRHLTPADYGMLEILHVTLAVLGIILIMGLSSALFKSYFSCEDQEKKKIVVGTAFLFLSVTSLGSLALLIVTAGYFSVLFFGSEEYTSYFRLVFLTLFFDVGIVVALSVFRAREESFRYALLSLSRLTLTAGLTIVFVVVLQRGVVGVLQAGLIAALVVYCSALAATARHVRIVFSLPAIKEMLSFGLPLVPAGLAAWVMTVGDRYFLQFMSTSQELGLYSLGYRLGMVVQALIVAPFNLAWPPFLLSVAKESNAKRIYSSVLTYFLLTAVSVGLALSLLSREVLMVMATPPFYAAYRVVPLIALSYILYGCYFVFYGGLWLEKKTKYIAAIVGVGAVANLGLNYLLIPVHGMMGAAVATLIAYLLLPIGSYIVSQRYYPIQYEWGRVAKISIAAGLVYAGSLFISSDSVVVAGMLKLVSLLGFPLLLFLFRFFKPEEVQKTKEILRALPGYAKRRWRGGRLLVRKEHPDPSGLPGRDEPDVSDHTEEDR